MSIITKIVKVILLSGMTAAVLAQSVDQRVRLNSVGFLPEYPKKATVQGSATGGFTVKAAQGDQTVHTGTLGQTFKNTDTNEDLRIADFTEFKTPGRYYLDVAGIGRSPVFSIGEDVFTEPYKTMMLGMYLWRCGTAVNATYGGENYQHAVCHIAPARTTCVPQSQTFFGQTTWSCSNTGPTTTRDGSGGWHDAGDYNKYMVNSGVATGLMLKAWENYGEALNKVDLHAVQPSNAYPAGMPKFLAEAKWNLDWVAKMQYDSAGQSRVSHKLSSSNFSADTILPENDLATQYFSYGGTEASGSFVGQMAQAARIYAQYDAASAASWLAKAKESYEWLAATPNFVAADLRGFNTGTYSTTDTEYSKHPLYDLDKRLWAAVELWEATGEARYLNDFESKVNVAHFGSETEWGEKDGVNALAYITYLTSEKTGKNAALVNNIRAKLITLADALADSASRHAYGRTFGSANYYWGGHGSLTATTYILNSAYRLTGDKKYRDAGHEVIGHILGRNYYGRSFVTGVGHNPPVNTHDRRSQATKKQWPGYLIGGPHNFSGATAALRCTGLDATCWRDDARDYWTNEIAINWNTSMIYALSGFLPGADSQGQASARQAGANRLVKPAARTSRIIQVNGGRNIDIPAGAKIYSLDGRLIAHRKSGDAMPVIRRNGVFIMKMDDKIQK
ncbi:MAG: glycoside hydrolase family 9 protein [Chitinispirillia bacterium]|nr:glycoside hydrolase family 9 protein [Chitinispirillia bacterium]